MCGRVTCKTSGEDLQRAFGLESLPLDLRPRYNIAPSQPLPVVVRLPDRVLRHFRWGLVPAWAKDEKIGNRMINARAETVEKKFRDALVRRRCLVAVDGFYEWRKNGAREPKTPVHIRLRSGAPFALAGLWERWTSPSGEVLESCAIITVPPNPLMKDIHDRMPAILGPEHYDPWLDPEVRQAERLLPLLSPWGRDDLEAYPVSPMVSSPSNDRPECVERVEPHVPPPREQLELL